MPFEPAVELWPDVPDDPFPPDVAELPAAPLVPDKFDAPEEPLEAEVPLVPPVPVEPLAL